MSPRVAFLLGRRPGEGSILPAVIERLRRTGATVDVHVLGAPPCIPERLRDADLVVLRNLPAAALEAARRLEEQGVRFCNTVSSSLAAADKVQAAALLAAGGVPTPRTGAHECWDEVVREAALRPVVVKPVGGTGGAGVRFLTSADEAGPAPWPGPFLVQERIDGDALDRKLYGVGTWVDGLLRRWPPKTLSDKRGRAFRPDPAMAELARAAGATLGLELYGVDVVVDGSGGATVVDVNAFPGFKGVPGAAGRVADHLLERARDHEVAR